MKTIPDKQMPARTMSPESIKRMEAKARKSAEQLELREIREALNISQRGLTPDMQIATLHKVVRALGGDIEVIARYQQAEVRAKRLAKSKRAKRVS